MTEDVNAWQFMIDHADALGIKLDFDEAGNVIMQENGLPSFSDYVGRGAGINKSAGLQKELGVFLNRMQRNDNCTAAGDARTYAEHAESNSAQECTQTACVTLKMTESEQRLHGSMATIEPVISWNLVLRPSFRTLLKSAKQVDPLLQRSQGPPLNFSNAVANGNPAEALQHLSVIGVEGAPANQRWQQLN